MKDSVVHILKNFKEIANTFGILLTVVSMVFLFNSKPILFKIILIIILFFLFAILSITLHWISERNKLSVNKGFSGDKSILVIANRRYIENMYNRHEYNDVCNFGNTFSRMFYIAGAYKSRIAITKLVLLSAHKLKQDKLCANSLIDIGWTILLTDEKSRENFQFDSAVLSSPNEYFERGIVYALKINDYQLVSKAYRHLSGYYITKNDFTKAKEFRDISEKYLNMMHDGVEKKIMQANLLYCDAETAFIQKDYSHAYDLCIQTDNLKKGNDEEAREIRFYAQIGKIFYCLERCNDAKENFLLGLDKAEKLKRQDEIAKNTYGYSLCLIKEGQKAKAKNKVEDFTKKNGHIPLFITDNFFINEYNTILGGE